MCEPDATDATTTQETSLRDAVVDADLGHVLRLVPRHLSSLLPSERRKVGAELPAVMAEAGARGCVQIVAYLLRQGAPPEGGLIAAAAAARAGHLDVVAHIALHTPIDLGVPVPGEEGGRVVEVAVQAAAWDIVQGLLHSGVPLTFRAARGIAEAAEDPTATALLALGLRTPRTDPLDLGWGAVMGGARTLRDAVVRWGVQCALRGTLTVQRGEGWTMSDRDRRRRRRSSPPLTVRDALPPYSDVAHPTDARADWERRTAWRSLFTFLVERGLPVPGGVLTWLVEEVRPCTDARLLQAAIGRSARVDGTLPDGRGPDVEVALRVAVAHRAPPAMVAMLLNAGADPLWAPKRADGEGPEGETAFSTAVALQQYDVLALLYQHPGVAERVSGEGRGSREWYTPRPTR